MARGISTAPAWTLVGLATIDGWRIPNPAILLILQSVADLGLLSGGVPAARQGSSGTDSAFYLKERSSLLKQSTTLGQHSLETVSMHVRCMEISLKVNRTVQTAGLKITKWKLIIKEKLAAEASHTYVHGSTTVQGQGGAIDPPLLL